jgi:membrane associated rhomboid family serine protease
MFAPTAQMSLLFFQYLYLPGCLVLYLVYCHFASKHARDNVNHDAHLYGALSGIVITFALHHNIFNEFVSQFTGAAQ